jgi:hypothetical protein
MHLGLPEGDQIYESLGMLGAAKDVGTKYWESGLTLDKKNGTGVECLKVIFPGLTSIRVVSTSAASQSWFLLAFLQWVPCLGKYK